MNRRKWKINSLKSVMVLWLFALAFIISSNVEARSNKYSSCLKQKDVPKCLVDLSSKSRWTSGSDLLKAVVTTGSIEYTKSRSKDLVIGALETISSANLMLKSIGIDSEKSFLEQSISKSEDTVILAAVALAAAAQISADPFDHPVVVEFIEKAKHNSAISVLAAKLWLELDVYGVWSHDVTRPPGLQKIWEKIIVEPKLDESILVDLANSGGFTEQARKFAFPLYQRFESLQDTSNESKAKIASSLARFYGVADNAKKLMESGGNKAKSFQISGVYAEIAVAELKEGYDRKSAQILLADLKEDTSLNSSYSWFAGIEARDALQESNAKIELIELGKLYLARADEEKRGAEDRANLYALASDCFLRVGDMEQAITVARRGFEVIPQALYGRLNEKERKKTKDNRSEQARLAHGFGAEPAVALYRSGAISEVLDSGYLTGFERYSNAKFVGENPNPTWVIDYAWPLEISVMISQAINKDDFNSRKNVYRKMIEAYDSKLEKTYELHEQLAALAASVGERSSMLLHFENYLKSLDKDTKEEAAYFSLELAEQWVRSIRILENAERNI